jgi:hypothetical protein
MTGSMRFVCDHTDCESSVTLGFKRDLENPKRALAQRGWRCLHRPPADVHLCPTHAGGVTTDPTPDPQPTPTG